MSTTCGHVLTEQLLVNKQAQNCGECAHAQCSKIQKMQFKDLEFLEWSVGAPIKVPVVRVNKNKLVQCTIFSPFRAIAKKWENAFYKIF